MEAGRGDSVAPSHESLSTALPASAADCCPFSTGSKTVIITWLLSLIPPVIWSSDLVNPSLERPQEVGTAWAAAAATPGGGVQEEDTATRSRAALTAVPTAAKPGQAGRNRLRQRQERNHVPSLPLPLGPRGPGLQLGRLGEPRG